MLFKLDCQILRRLFFGPFEIGSRKWRAIIENASELELIKSEFMNDVIAGIETIKAILKKVIFVELTSRNYHDMGAIVGPE